MIGGLKLAKQIKLLGCDISHWQGNIDFKKLAKLVNFVIIKLGGSDTTTDFFYIDKNFESYYAAAKAAGLSVGCYWFVGKNSTGSEDGLREAKYIHAAIKDKSFEMPVYIDFEKGSKIYKDKNTAYCVACGNALEKLGYFVGIYASDISGFKEMLNLTDLRRFSLWVARYGKEPQYVTNYHLWQYSSKGNLDGIIGYVDLDYAYLDLPKIIKSKHFNNC